MRKRIVLILSLFFIFIFVLTGCNGIQTAQSNQSAEYVTIAKEGESTIDTALIDIVPTEKIVELEDGFSVVQYNSNPFAA